MTGETLWRNGRDRYHAAESARGWKHVAEPRSRSVTLRSTSKMSPQKEMVVGRVRRQQVEYSRSAASRVARSELRYESRWCVSVRRSLVLPIRAALQRTGTP